MATPVTTTELATKPATTAQPTRISTPPPAGSVCGHAGQLSSGITLEADRSRPSSDLFEHDDRDLPLCLLLIRSETRHDLRLRVEQTLPLLSLSYSCACLET